MKPVRLSAHALGYTSKRGFTIAEVEKAIQHSSWEPAESGRFQPSRVGIAYRLFGFMWGICADASG